MFNLSGPCELLFLFYFLLDLSCGECYVISLYFVCCSVGVSALCGACFSVCDLFGETIHNMLWCGSYFVVKCYGCGSSSGCLTGSWSVWSHAVTPHRTMYHLVFVI